MKITTHRKNTTNLILFLQQLGFRTFVSNIYQSCDEIMVGKDERQDFLSKVKQYVEKYGFVPYHYTLSFGNEGYGLSVEKVSFEGLLTGTTEFTSVSGKFQLLSFESVDNCFAWKTYSGKEYTYPPDSPLIISGKLKAVITGTEGKINLLSNVRIKEKLKFKEI